MTIQLQYVHIYTECLLNPVQIINSYKPLLKRYLASVSGGFNPMHVWVYDDQSLLLLPQLWIITLDEIYCL